MATYRAKDVDLTVGGVDVSTGLASGTFVKAARNNPAFSLPIGSSGEGCFVQNADQSGYIEFTLMQSSAANAALMDLFNSQESGGQGPVAAVINDRNSDHRSELVGMLERPAEQEYSNELTNRVWRVIGPVLLMTGGGVTSV